ncbi:MAG: sn-glycerol-3-phosphate ABC transporter ATP-binding protein UgpC [Elusimicrobiota bacterium]
MAGVRFATVTKKYDTTVVDRMDLEAAEGEFVVLVGPSGCGKSTSLRMLAGLESVTAGRIHIGDRDVTAMHPKDRNVAMVFQDYALYPHMTVRENMSLGLKVRKLEPAEIERRVADAVRILQLEPFLDKKPGQLSGGQRQRVAMGRAIVKSPDVFLFDEPLSNLDAKLRSQLRVEISKLHRLMKKTIFYVTHDQVEAMTLGDKIAVMHGGKIQQIGPPMELYRRPANKFVAGFIGSPQMNFFNAELREEGGELMLHSALFSAAVPGPARERLKDAPRKVIAGCRPQDVRYTPNPSPNEEAAAEQVEAYIVEQRGSEAFLHCVRGGEKFIAVSAPDDAPAPGSVITARFNSARFHYFDPASGASLLA